MIRSLMIDYFSFFAILYTNHNLKGTVVFVDRKKELVAL